MMRGASFFRRRFPTVFLVLLGACFLSGCGLYSDFKTATRDIDFGWADPDPNLRRKIVFAPVQNRSTVDAADYRQLFADTLIATIADENKGFLLVRPEDPGVPEALRRLPEIKPGLLDNQALAAAGRKIGANAVVTATIYDISGKQERRGVLIFRETRSYIQFNMGVAAFDMETGAKLFDQTYQDEIEVDELELEILRRDRRIQTPEMEAAVAEAAQELAEAVCERIEEEPWKSFVSAAAERVRISAGSAAGLKVGDVLDLFAPGRKMASASGQHFFLPGEKVARIRIASVAADTSEADVLTQTEEIAPGYTARTPAD